jgi:hypothetical protein
MRTFHAGSRSCRSPGSAFGYRHRGITFRVDNGRLFCGGSSTCEVRLRPARPQRPICHIQPAFYRTAGTDPALGRLWLGGGLPSLRYGLGRARHQRRLRHILLG